MTLNSDAPPAENRQEALDLRDIELPISVQVNTRQGDSLTTRQAQLLRGIEYVYATLQRGPRRRELLSMLGTTSQGCLTEALEALETKGYLRIVPRVAGGLIVLIPSSHAAIDDSKSPLARAARPGIAKARPRVGAERKVG